jgi:uncharacterized protein YutD
MKNFTITLFIIIALSLLGIYWTKSKIEIARISQLKKIEHARSEYGKEIKEVTVLANELLKELQDMPMYKLPSRYKEVFSKVDLSSIISDINFDDLDMNVGFSFHTNEKNTKTTLLTDIDYDIGEYAVTPNAAFIVLKVMEKAINQSLRDLITDFDIKTKIQGIADGIPVRRKIYRGKDAILNERYFNLNTGHWEKITLIPNQSARTNKSIAFLRAYYVRELIKHINFIDNFPIEMYVEEVEEIGKRKAIIQVNMEVKNIFKEQYDKFDLFEKVAFRLYNEPEKLQIRPVVN